VAVVAATPEHDGDVGALVPAKTQPLTRASTTSAADLDPNLLREEDMVHLPVRVVDGHLAVPASVRPSAWTDTY
jgi:hypothetical protein